MMKDLGVVDENVSNMTSAASSEISASNSVTASLLYPQQSATTSTAQEPPPPQAKRKRNLPGHPDPEAEVIALSPKTLMATNRFICDVCNKGFQRDQNLQLHRRGHNLPWKLKQRSNKEIVRKKVYVCPETSCVHHEPSRALGDLTGIKKHFCRKHGEKKWKCDKCSKRYAVQSDWKAHFKICGTREYRCDCGTIFSRRDSFIAHRAFCEALAQESSKAIMNPLLSSSSSSSHIQGHHLLHALPSSVKKELQEANLRPPEIPSSWFTHNGRGALTALGFTSPPPPLPPPNENPNPSTLIMPPPPNSCFQPIGASRGHMSATALLQKASQIGATMSRTTASSLAPLNKPYPRAGHVEAEAYNSNVSMVATSSTSSSAAAVSGGLLIMDKMHSREEIRTLGPFSHALASYGGDNDMIDGNVVSPFEEALRGIINNNNIPRGATSNSSSNNNNDSFAESHQGRVVNDDEMTRDFLGIGVFSQRDLFNIAGLDYGKQNQNPPPWQG